MALGEVRPLQNPITLPPGELNPRGELEAAA